MNSQYSKPVNIGNPQEYTVRQLAVLVKRLANSSSEIVHLPASRDDPRQRKPDISTAFRELGWRPHVKVETGLLRAISYFSR
jgi:UDP-glucuronate decarboxylase